MALLAAITLIVGVSLLAFHKDVWGATYPMPLGVTYMGNVNTPGDDADSASVDIFRGAAYVRTVPLDTVTHSKYFWFCDTATMATAGYVLANYRVHDGTDTFLASETFLLMDTMTSTALRYSCLSSKQCLERI